MKLKEIKHCIIVLFICSLVHMVLAIVFVSYSVVRRRAKLSSRSMDIGLVFQELKIQRFNDDYNHTIIKL